MKKLLFLFLFFVLLTSARASHIVGGELALVHIPGTLYRYRVEMILYYDSKNGDTGGDLQATIRIFKKRNNTSLFDLTLNAQGAIFNDGNQVYAIGTQVEYFQPVCSDGSIITNKVFYISNEFQLAPDQFNDVMGYYMVYERCCRNYEIDNIVSDRPVKNQNNELINYSQVAGQIFYLEFPPVIVNGETFINSSPKLFPPLSDYGCPNRSYFVDFAGTDEDGDSLAYSLVTPINSKERSFALPLGGPNPGPYDSITWKSGFSNTNYMNGNPDLKISDEGLLTVTPTSNSTGLYVFAVRCEEYRNGVKIGEVRRDFQMLVQNSCPEAEPPRIVGKGPTDVAFGNTGELTVTYENTVSNTDRCFEVRVTDPDALKFDDNFSESIKIKAIPIGFKRNINEVLPFVKTGSISSDGSLVFKICLPQCPYNITGNFKIGIIAFDDACTLPLSDTLIVNVDLEPPANSPPNFTNPDGEEIIEVLSEGGPPQSWDIHVADADGDILTYQLLPKGNFILSDFGMSFTGTLSGQQASPLDKQLTWDPKCDVYNFTEKNNFELYFIVEDNDLCKWPLADTTYFNLSITDFSQITPPVLDNSLLAGADTIELTRKIYDDPLIIDVTGFDIDNTNVLLRGNGIGFNASTYGVTFPRDFNQGSVSTQFNWYLDCEKIDLNVKSDFEFDLMVVDSLNKCRFYKADTLHLIVHVEPPDNVTPNLSIASENVEQPISYSSSVEGSFSAILRSPISLKLLGTDDDNPPKDRLTIELIDQSEVSVSGFNFTHPQTGNPLNAEFNWSPDCSIFSNDDFENEYTLKFILRDNRCFNAAIDSITLHLTVQDVDGSDDDFLPPNVFTPNDDGKNDFFAMLRQTELGELENILPDDNCLGEFLGITIYNRWGKQVYQNESREFRWYGGDLPVGVYYYYIRYSNKSYKGWVHLRL